MIFIYLFLLTEHKRLMDNRELLWETNYLIESTKLWLFIINDKIRIINMKSRGLCGVCIKRYSPPVLIIIFFYKIYSLCKNNAISNFFYFKPKFLINYRPFTSVVLCTQTLHQQWLHTCTCYENHRSATIMVIKFELKNVDLIGTSTSFWQKKGNAETLKAIVCQTAPLAKLPLGGFLFIHEIWRFQTKCRIF